MDRNELIEAMALAISARYETTPPDMHEIQFAARCLNDTAAALSAIEAQGLAIVPVEPDDKILTAGVRQSASYPVCPPDMSIEPVHQFTLTCCYRAMIEAGKV